MTPALPRSLQAHALWRHFSTAIVVEAGTLLATGHKHRRIELHAAGFTDEQVAGLLGLRIACAACTAPISPFRRRKGKSAGRSSRPGRLFVALTCELSARIGCSRGTAATDAYERLIRALQSRPPTAPPAPSSSSPSSHPTPAVAPPPGPRVQHEGRVR